VPVQAPRPPSGTGVSAHRGASAERPENTLAAFRTAIAHGCEGVELDVALTADGVPVVLHDRTVDRTTDGSGEVAELTLEQVRALRTADGEPVPTLAEVLALCAGHVEVNVEIKDRTAAGAVLAVADGFPTLDWFASSAQWDALRELRQLSPTVVLYPLSTGVMTLDDLRAQAISAGYSAAAVDAEFARMSHLGQGLPAAVEFAAEIGARGLSVAEPGLTAEDVASVHAAGLAVWAWTTNDPGRAADLMHHGVDAICTDDPATVLAVRASLGR
jgi:glycerophosphoryl diester phosphodiesterase